MTQTRSKGWPRWSEPKALSCTRGFRCSGELRPRCAASERGVGSRRSIAWDLLDSGRLLAGSDDTRSELPRPTSAELIVTGSEFALDYLAGVRAGTAPEGTSLGSMRLAGERAVEELRDPELLVRRGVRRVTKLVLFPVRFLYTAITGRVGTNDAAVDHYLERREAPSAELVAAARRWRTGVPFEARPAADLLSRQLVPLYIHYIEDHIARLRALNRDDLSAAFQTWRQRLIA